MFDIRYQHALHTTSFKEQPVSKNSLTNFQATVYRYNQEHGVDLIQEEIEAQAKSFSKLLKIDGKTARMDSFMMSSSCKKLSRLQIIYSIVAILIKVIDKNSLPEYFNHYLVRSSLIICFLYMYLYNNYKLKIANVGSGMSSNYIIIQLFKNCTFIMSIKFFLQEYP